jgi:hypothetical protein
LKDWRGSGSAVIAGSGLGEEFSQAGEAVGKIIRPAAKPNGGSYPKRTLARLRAKRWNRQTLADGRPPMTKMFGVK